MLKKSDGRRVTKKSQNIVLGIDPGDGMSRLAELMLEQVPERSSAGRPQPAFSTQSALSRPSTGLCTARRLPDSRHSSPAATFLASREGERGQSYRIIPTLLRR